MNPAWAIRTARLLLTPVAATDLPDLIALKSDPRVFAVMLGGVRTAQRAAEELAEDIRFWSAHGCGMWSVRAADDGQFLGVVGFMDRPDGRGLALRFALWPGARGKGLAREAAGAALRFAHDRAGLSRVVAVARESNFASRTVLGSIGMHECARFRQDGHEMVLFESHAGEVRMRQEPETHSFPQGGAIPNSALPLLIWRAALPADASAIEAAFTRNGWSNGWRDGIYPFHHFHSIAHEVLGIAAGEAQVAFGGPEGRVLPVRAGDVVAIPAGVGHCNAGASPDFLVVGAYPGGAAWDLCRGDPTERERVLANIARVPLPARDPVEGEGGALLRLWRSG